MNAAELAAVVEAIAPVVRQYVDEALTRDRLTAELAITKTLGPFGERLATLEARPPQPGPPGRDGVDGLPGPAGADGTPGTPGVTYRGVYIDGDTYARGDLVTWAGSAWHCHAETTTTKPGDGAASWQLMVKRGRDGRDGKTG